MLYLRTGLPGAGKTLNAIREIDLEHRADPADPSKRLHKDHDNPDLPPRTIYYYGIPDLKADRLKSKWVEFDTPEKWFDLPDGSVIVIDEAQRVFGNDGTRARPEKVTRFETHRHQGLDIHLITQHPSLLSTPVRKLVGKHINFIRPYGREKGIFRHEYEFCIDSPEKRVNFKQAQEEKVALDPTYFGVYKSSTVHTHKPITPSYIKKLPLLITLALLPILLLVALGYWLIGSNKDEMERLRSKHPKQPAAVAASASSDAVSAGSGVDVAPTAKQPDKYFKQRTPRVADVPASAPVYDELMRPKSFPKPVCAATRDPMLVSKAKARGLGTGRVDGVDYACQCYSQQVTKMHTSFDFCMDVVNNGFFDDTKVQPSYASGHNGNGSLNTVPSSEPAAAIQRGRAATSPTPVDSYSSAPTVTIVEDHEYSSRPWR